MFRRGGNKDGESPSKEKMLAAQAIKQRRALEEDLERSHHEHGHHHHHHQHVDHDGHDETEEGYESGSEEELEEEEALIEVPKYLQGIPLVDTHSTIEGVSSPNSLIVSLEGRRVSGRRTK